MLNNPRTRSLETFAETLTPEQRAQLYEQVDAIYSIGCGNGMKCMSGQDREDNEWRKYFTEKRKEQE